MSTFPLESQKIILWVADKSSCVWIQKYCSLHDICAVRKHRDYFEDVIQQTALFNVCTFSQLLVHLTVWRSLSLSLSLRSRRTTKSWRELRVGCFGSQQSSRWFHLDKSFGSSTVLSVDRWDGRTFISRITIDARKRRVHETKEALT